MTVAQYLAIPANAAHDILSESSDDEGSCADHEVLKEEEEREKLLAGGNGLFSGKPGVKIGKKVRSTRGKKKGFRDVVEMMGGKRLGMEEGESLVLERIVMTRPTVKRARRLIY